MTGRHRAAALRRLTGLSSRAPDPLTGLRSSCVLPALAKALPPDRTGFAMVPPAIAGRRPGYKPLLRRYRVRQIALSEYRLLVWGRRQLPGASRWRTNFRVHMDVKHIRLVRLDCMFECASEVLRLGDRDRLNPCGPRPPGKVRIVWRLVGPFVKHGPV